MFRRKRAVVHSPGPPPTQAALRRQAEVDKALEDAVHHLEKVSGEAVEAMDNIISRLASSEKGPYI